MVFRLKNKQDHEVEYGLLTISDSVTEDEVAEQIDHVVSLFSDVGWKNYSVDDVLSQFPNEWNADFQPAKQKWAPSLFI